MFLGNSALTPQFGNCVQERPFCKTRKAICLRLHIVPFLESNQEHNFLKFYYFSLFHWTGFWSIALVGVSSVKQSLTFYLWMLFICCNLCDLLLSLVVNEWRCLYLCWYPISLICSSRAIVLSSWLLMVKSALSNLLWSLVSFVWIPSWICNLIFTGLSVRIASLLSSREIAVYFFLSKFLSGLIYSPYL